MSGAVADRTPGPAGLGTICPSPLEDWLRERYFTARIDISSSGMEPYSLGELRHLLGISTQELDAIQFRDSPSLGSDELRAAVAARFGAPASTVMVTHGSTEGIFLAFSALVRPGDEVVVLRPAYQSLFSVAESIGARIRWWDLDPEQGFRPDLGRLRELLNDRTRVVVVNFPHNPTGVTLDPAGYAELLRLVAAHGCHLFWDAAFGELVYDQPVLADPGTSYERAISFGTLSKTYGLPGLRVGWCIGHPAVLQQMVTLRDYVSLNTSPVTELLATAVLTHADRIVGPLLARARHNRDLMAEWAQSHRDLIDWPRPSGGVTAFPRVRGMASTEQLCRDLITEHGVLVVPGNCFAHPDRMRMGFGGPPGELSEGLAIVARVIAQAREAA